MILLSLFAVIMGIAVLVYGAEKFIRGASVIAVHYDVSPLLIGLTIVALGTSLPELVVSFIAALHDNPDLAIGNAIGSNITNVGLVLGITALVVPIEVKSSILRREFPILGSIMLLCYLLMQDLELSHTDGYILLGGLVCLVIWLIYTGIQEAKDEPMSVEYSEELPEKSEPISKGWLWLAIGFILMPISSRVIVWGAVNVAQYFGISELIIGLTVLALGTSLPELSASIVSVMKKEPDIAVGNVIGSNMFNLLGVTGISATVSSAQLPGIFLTRDFATMILLTLFLFIFAYGLRKPGKISRFEGAALLIGYISYLVALYMTAQ